MFATGGTKRERRDTESSMQYEWVEDDHDLPAGVMRLGESAPEFGREYIMYHGTSSRAAEAIKASGFRPSEDGMLGRGVYLSSDLYKASRNPTDIPEADRVVIVVRVEVRKVIVIKRQRFQRTWHDQKYDTAWVHPGSGMVEGGLEEICVWDPEQIQIIGTIKPYPVQPQPVQCQSEGGAHAYM